MHSFIVFLLVFVVWFSIGLISFFLEILLLKYFDRESVREYDVRDIFFTYVILGPFSVAVVIINRMFQFVSFFVGKFNFTRIADWINK